MSRDYLLMSRDLTVRCLHVKRSSPGSHRSGHRHDPGRLGHHLPGGDRVLAPRPSAPRCDHPGAPRRHRLRHHRPPAAERVLVVAIRRARRLEHRRLLRAVVRRRVPPARRRGRDRGCTPTTHRRRARRGAARGTTDTPELGRRCDRARRGGDARAAAGRRAGCGRARRGVRRDDVDGGRRGAHQALGPPGGAGRLHRLAAVRRRSVPAAAGPRVRGNAERGDHAERGRLRLARRDRNGARLCELVPRRAVTPGRGDEPPRAAQPGRRHHRRMDRARPDAPARADRRRDRRDRCGHRTTRPGDTAPRTNVPAGLTPTRWCRAAST